ncbi:MAG: M28 family peptidase [Planctomycetota bacterium]|nr:M28 family peptidase [Planctomycetota bacterium]
MRTNLIASASLSVPVLALLLGSCAATPPATAAPVSSAATSTDPRAAGVQRMFAEALRSQNAHVLLSALCAAAPKRLSGSEGAAHAVAWAESAMRAAGLEHVRLEPVRVPRWERGEVERLEILGPGADTLAVRALGGSVATPPGGIEAEVVRVTSFEELAARAAEARGHFVFFDRPMDATLPDPFDAYRGAVNQRGRGAVEAAQVGAVGALVRSMTLALDDHPHTGALRYEDGVARLPAAALSTLAADRLAGRIAAGAPVRLRLELACRTLPDVDSFNVVGEVLGREIPEQIVLLGGHLDAWDVGDGAHDDGAGCAQVLEAARLLLALDLRPRRTVRVCLFMNEENGLRGGTAYRDTHRDELARHVLSLESDRGGFAPRGFATDAPPGLYEELAGAARLLAPWGAATLRVGGGGSDIGPLREHGVPLAEYLPDPARYFDFHHAETDVIAAVHPRELSLGAAAIAAFAWCAADAR